MIPDLRHFPLLRKLALVEGLAIAGFVGLFLHTGYWPVLGGVFGAIIASFVYLRRLNQQDAREGKRAR